MNWREISIAVPQKTSETHPHAAPATRRTYRWLLEPILPLIERCKNFREARLALIVKRAARLILSSQCRSSTSLTGLSLAGRAGTLLAAPFAFPSPFPEIAILRLHHVHLPELWNWRKSRRLAIPNPCPVLAARNAGRGRRIRPARRRSGFDADDEGTATRLPDDRGMGKVDSDRGRRYPRMRGARLDEGPQRSPCPRARPSRCTAGTAARCLSG